MHTPGTERHNEFGGTLKESDILEKFKNKIIENKIDAIGVTDYYSIDNYEYLVELQKSGKFPQNVYLLPNIEIRLENSVRGKSNELVNLHILFDPEKLSPEDIRTEFLSQLCYEYNQHTFKFNESGLESLRSATNSKSIKDVKERFSISKKALLELLKSNIHFEGAYLIAVPNEDISGTLQSNSGKGDFIYDDIANITDIVFSHNINDYNFWLGKDSLQRKPVISGSDAHSFKNQDETGSHYGIGEEYTWIKSALSFEGLRQVLFEPENRVRIKALSLNNPIESRSGYIKSVQLDSNSDKIKVTPNVIPMNSNLTTIIGARSSGKSVLEALIAHKNYIDDPDHIAKKTLSNYDDIIKNVSVNLKGDSTDEFINKVTYYPQNFISDLSENIDTLQKIITDIVTGKTELNILISNYKNDIASSLYDIKELVSQYKEANTTVNEVTGPLLALGDKEHLVSERNSLDAKRKKVYDQSTLTDSQNDSRASLEIEHQTLLAEYTMIDENLQKLSENWRTLSSAFNSIEDQLPLIRENVPETFKDNSKIDRLISNAKEFKSKVENYLNDIGKKMNQRFDEIKSQNYEIENKLDAFQTKDTSLNSQLSSYNEQIKTLDNQISQITLLEGKKASAEKQKEELENRLFEIIENIQDLYTMAPGELSKSLSLGTVDGKNIKLTLQNSTNFDVLDFFDKRKLAGISNKIRIITESPNTFKWAETNALIGEIKTLLEQDESVFVKGNKPIDVVFAIINQIFPLKLDLIYGTDTLSSMSPGMRGVVLLQILLGNQNSQSPVLLDQPEDDLDNNTIAEVLVPLIKNVSKTRQVILVTHNANLVVLTDADEVIVAERSDSNFNVEYHHGPLEDDAIKDNITTLLEGGKDAFKLREKRYDFKV